MRRIKRFQRTLHRLDSAQIRQLTAQTLGRLLGVLLTLLCALPLSRHLYKLLGLYCTVCLFLFFHPPLCLRNSVRPSADFFLQLVEMPDLFLNLFQLRIRLRKTAVDAALELAAPLVQPAHRLRILHGAVSGRRQCENPVAELRCGHRLIQTVHHRRSAESLLPHARERLAAGLARQHQAFFSGISIPRRKLLHRSALSGLPADHNLTSLIFDFQNAAHRLSVRRTVPRFVGQRLPAVALCRVEPVEHHTDKIAQRRFSALVRQIPHIQSVGKADFSAVQDAEMPLCTKNPHDSSPQIWFLILIISSEAAKIYLYFPSAGTELQQISPIPPFRRICFISSISFKNRSFLVIFNQNPPIFPSKVNILSKFFA